MGRRHLLGLARAGLQIDALDPSPKARESALDALAQAGIDAASVRLIDAVEPQAYEVAVFSEPADFRLGNVTSFLARAKAGRYLLEKPISADPAEVERTPALFESHGIPLDHVAVNLARRAWPHTSALKKLADRSPRIAMTVNGGAFGLGGNGIHHIDLFLHLTGHAETDVRYAQLLPEPIASGRGERFRDFGGEIVLGNARGSFHAVCLPTSSAAAVLTVAGDHFCGVLDERTLNWKLVRRSDDSRAPAYRCGLDYQVESDAPAEIVAMDVATGLWARGSIHLPTLPDALIAHRLLHAALQKGGATPPFHYT